MKKKIHKEESARKYELLKCQTEKIQQFREIFISNNFKIQYKKAKK